MGVGADHSTGSLGMARRQVASSMVVTLLRGGVLLGMLLAISGAASPWGGEDESQLASHQSSSLANNGVRSVMKRGAEVVKRKSKKKSVSGTEKKKKKKGEEKKNEKNVEKGKNRKG